MELLIRQSHPAPTVPLDVVRVDAPDALLTSFAEACAYFARVSGGAARIVVTELGDERLPPAQRLALEGNYATARAALGRLRPELTAPGPRPLLVIGPPGSRPHAWVLPSTRRYALVPADASPAMVAHELGHLLFTWPDLPLPSHQPPLCLMTRLDARAPPPLPCAPLLVASAWRNPPPLVPGTPATALQSGGLYAVSHDLLVERRDNTLLAWAPGPRLSRMTRVSDAVSCTLDWARAKC